MEVQASVPSVPLTGPVLVASRANLVPSTDPLAASNVEFGRGLQPPSSDFLYGPNPNPSPTSPTPPATSFQGGAPVELTGGTVTILHVPISDSYESTAATSGQSSLYKASSGKGSGSAQSVGQGQGTSSEAALVAGVSDFLDATKSHSGKTIHGGVTSIDIKA